MGPLSLYLHIPFCRHRCAYCDFNTYTTVSDLREEYVAALIKEIRQVAMLAENAEQLRPLQSVYFGGGTPSLLPVEDLQRILKCTAESFGYGAQVEITLEANPDFIQMSYLEGLREIGVNRLSFGVQSAQADELALLERSHDFQTVVNVVNMARQAGFDNFSLDLIYGLPRQTISSWSKSLAAVLELAPPHLSLYCLTIEPGTPMNRWLESGQIFAPDPDLAADQYEYACDFLQDKGFKHYEISNWSQPGFECRHNLTYWRNQEYLGLGAGAHGQAAGYRYWVVKQPRVYIRRMGLDQSALYPLSAATADSHLVNCREAMSDTVITQLRLLEEGLDLKAFYGKFGQSLDEAYDGQVTQLKEWGLLEQIDDRLILTEDGRFISNQVFYRFM